MPFTANRAFKARPRMLAGAKDMHYFTTDGRSILDGAAGMWCSNAVTNWYEPCGKQHHERSQPETQAAAPDLFPRPVAMKTAHRFIIAAIRRKDRYSGPRVAIVNPVNTAQYQGTTDKLEWRRQFT